MADKLEELGKINLTRDEKHLLIFTSMMDEEINNLVISNSKFLDWFQIDFADDTQEETDFMQNRWEAWYLALKAAKMIVAECQKNIAAPLSDN